MSVITLLVHVFLGALWWIIIILAMPDFNYFSVA